MLGIGLAPQMPRRMSLVEVIHSLEPDCFWPLWERSGVVAADLIGGNDAVAACGWNGQGACFPFATLDGSQNVSLPVAALNSLFNPDEGYVIAWGFADAALWVAAGYRALWHIGWNVENRHMFYHQQGGGNALRFYLRHAAIPFYQKDWNSGGTTAVFGSVVTWSVANNKVYSFVNGVQVGTDEAYGDTYVGGVNDYHFVGSTQLGDYWLGGAGMIAVGSHFLDKEDCKRVTVY